MAGRLLAGFGVAIVRSAAPAFVTEIAPLQWRGPATLLYNSLWLIGAILASSIAYASGPMKSSLSILEIATDSSSGSVNDSGRFQPFPP
jgi:MFS family permease